MLYVLPMTSSHKICHAFSHSFPLSHVLLSKIWRCSEMTNRAKRRRIVGERHLEHDLDTLGTLCRHFPQLLVSRMWSPSRTPSSRSLITASPTVVRFVQTYYEIVVDRGTFEFKIPHNWYSVVSYSPREDSSLLLNSVFVSTTVTGRPECWRTATNISRDDTG